MPASTFRRDEEVLTGVEDLQVLAATVECTDMRYLPDNLRKEVDDPEAYEELVSRLKALQAHEALD